MWGESGVWQGGVWVCLGRECESLFWILAYPTCRSEMRKMNWTCPTLSDQGSEGSLPKHFGEVCNVKDIV